MQSLTNSHKLSLQSNYNRLNQHLWQVKSRNQLIITQNKQIKSKLSYLFHQNRKNMNIAPLNADLHSSPKKSARVESRTVPHNRNKNLKRQFSYSKDSQGFGHWQQRRKRRVSQDNIDIVNLNEATTKKMNLKHESATVDEESKIDSKKRLLGLIAQQSQRKLDHQRVITQIEQLIKLKKEQREKIRKIQRKNKKMMRKMDRYTKKINKLSSKLKNDGVIQEEKLVPSSNSHKLVIEMKKKISQIEKMQQVIENKHFHSKQTNKMIKKLGQNVLQLINQKGKLRRELKNSKKIPCRALR